MNISHNIAGRRSSERIASYVAKSIVEKDKPPQGQMNIPQKSRLRKSTGLLSQNTYMEKDETFRKQYSRSVYDKKRCSERIASQNVEKSIAQKENIFPVPLQRSQITDSQRNTKQKYKQMTLQNNSQSAKLKIKPGRISNRRSTIAIPEEVPLEVQLRNSIREEQEKNISLTNDYENLQKRVLETSGKYDELKTRFVQLEQNNIQLLEDKRKLQIAAKTYFQNYIRDEHNYIK